MESQRISICSEPNLISKEQPIIFGKRSANGNGDLEEKLKKINHNEKLVRSYQKQKSKFTVSTAQLGNNSRRQLFEEKNQKIQRSLTMFELQNSQKEEILNPLSKKMSTSTKAIQKVLEIEGTGKEKKEVVYEAAFKMILKSWRKKQDSIEKLLNEMNRKESSLVKYKTQLHTVQSLYKNECKHSSEYQEENKNLKSRIEIVSTKLNQQKADNSALKFQLEQTIQDCEKLEILLSKNHSENEKVIFRSNAFEHQLKQQTKKCVQLEKEKSELQCQIDELEKNFKNFEKDYENSVLDHVQTTKNVEKQIKMYRIKLGIEQGKLSECQEELERGRKFNLNLVQLLQESRRQYMMTFSYKFRNFFINLPREPVYYLHYTLHLIMKDVPAPQRRVRAIKDC